MKQLISVLLILMFVSVEANARFTEVGIHSPGNETQNFVRPTGAPTSAAQPADSWAKMTTQVKSWFQAAKDKMMGTKPERSPASEPAIAPATTPAEATAAAPTSAMPAPASPEEIKNASAFAEIAKAKQALKDKGALAVTTPGRKAEANKDLKMSQRGVPLYKNFDKMKISVRSVPKLDIGEEPRISANDFTIPNFNFDPVKIKTVEKLSSPSLMSNSALKDVTEMKVKTVVAVKNVDHLRKDIGQIVTRDSIANVQYKITTPPEVTLKPTVTLSEDDLKMLSTVLLFQKGDRCAVVMGLTEDLAQEAKFKNEANYYGGTCAMKLKMFTDGFKRLSAVIDSEDADFTADALSSMIQDSPAAYHTIVGEKLLSVKNLSKWIKAKDQDRANYFMARTLYKKEQWDAARGYAEKISEKSPDYGAAQYLAGIANYNSDKLPKAIAVLEGLRKWMAQSLVTDKNLNSLTAVNLARMKFKQNQFKEAFDLYMKVDKDHPLWVQALEELGWVQFHIDDPSGAIGNMYSLHSPYFAAVYKPESFVIRTIGYLSICQYGDAYKTLTYLEKEYRNANEQAKIYLEKNKGTGAFYESVKGYLRSASSASIDGLQGPILREMARQKDFLNVQMALNDSEDELARYNGIHEKIRSDKAQVRGRLDLTQKRHDQLVAQLKRGKKPGEAFDEDRLNSLIRLDTDLIVAYKYLLSILEQGRQGFLKSQAKGTEHIAKFKAQKRNEASRILEARLKVMHKEMSKILENNELLRYEVFAGSGENIRYQVAGGTTNAAAEGPGKRIPAHVKPEKILNWNFDGEYWEDEIGSYRSSLQNNCPKTAGRIPASSKGAGI